MTPIYSAGAGTADSAGGAYSPRAVSTAGTASWVGGSPFVLAMLGPRRQRGLYLLALFGHQFSFFLPALVHLSGLPVWRGVAPLQSRRGRMDNVVWSLGLGKTTIVLPGPVRVRNISSVSINEDKSCMTYKDSFCYLGENLAYRVVRPWLHSRSIYNLSYLRKNNLRLIKINIIRERENVFIDQQKKLSGANKRLAMLDLLLNENMMAISMI
ncbi:hypothetical protein NQ317_013681 [Molorchus minor]|uniref:Uncharacterized protein n=1 Tax=Molorchus minor TaxID=1323400 RepID=A0ABQ9JB99_9CUCU|nr:hypothetical protein NQ317_013681 [Molorchus minor]